MLMELILLAQAAQDAVSQQQQAWPPAHAIRLARVLQPHLLAIQRPPELLLGPEQQRADFLVCPV